MLSSHSVLRLLTHNTWASYPPTTQVQGTFVWFTFVIDAYCSSKITYSSVVFLVFIGLKVGWLGHISCKMLLGIPRILGAYEPAIRLNQIVELSIIWLVYVRITLCMSLILLICQNSVKNFRISLDVSDPDWMFGSRVIWLPSRLYASKLVHMFFDQWLCSISRFKIEVISLAHGDCRMRFLFVFWKAHAQFMFHRKNEAIIC